jgi:hypothetical protein
VPGETYRNENYNYNDSSNDYNSTDNIQLTDLLSGPTPTTLHPVPPVIPDPPLVQATVNMAPPPTTAVATAIFQETGTPHSRKSKSYLLTLLTPGPPAAINIPVSAVDVSTVTGGGDGGGGGYGMFKEIDSQPTPYFVDGEGEVYREFKDADICADRQRPIYGLIRYFTAAYKYQQTRSEPIPRIKYKEDLYILHHRWPSGAPGGVLVSV